MIAILTGSTGLTGSLLLQHLLRDPAITKVVCVLRRPGGLTHPKLTEIRIADLAELQSLSAQMKGDLYFCCLGTTIKVAGSKETFEKVDHDAVVAFATIARAHEASSFVLVSAMGANASSKIFYNRVKGQTEDDVRKLGLRSLTILRPALLVGPRRDFRLGERIAQGTLVPFAKILPNRVAKSFLTNADTLAARMLDEAKAARAGGHVIPARDI